MSQDMSVKIERHFDHPKKDGSHKQSVFRKWLKKSKIRTERRKAKLNPEAFPAYRKFQGWEY